MVRCIAKECKPFFARVKREIDFFCEEETGAAYRGRNPLSVLRQHLTTTSSKSRTGGLRFGLALVYINPTLVLSLGAREDVCPVSTRDKEDDTATSARIKSGADSSDARRRDRSRWKAAMFVCVVWVRVMQIPAGQVTVKVGHQTVDDSGVCFELSIEESDNDTIDCTGADGAEDGARALRHPYELKIVHVSGNSLDFDSVVRRLMEQCSESLQSHGVKTLATDQA